QATCPGERRPPRVSLLLPRGTAVAYRTVSALSIRQGKLVDMLDTAARSDLGSLVLPRETAMTSRYERVAESIRAQIRSGELAPGAKLPSTRELKAIYGVSYVTLRTAIMQLKAEGLLRGE